MKSITATFTSLTILFAILASVSASSKCPKYLFKTFAHTSHDAHGLKSTVDNYIHFLGGPDNGSNPPTGGKGQRSINWDGAGVPFNMPFDFFNINNATRGAVFFSKSNKFVVSNPRDPPHFDDRFSSIVPSFISKRFVRFSLDRLFSPLLDNKLTVKFEIPGKRNVAALTRGFGAVFTDVDLHKTTTMIYYDKNGCVIAAVPVPAKSKGLSFSGIIVLNQHRQQISAISRVVVKLGNLSLAQASKLKHHSTGDVVVMDDFFYGEPTY